MCASVYVRVCPQCSQQTAAQWVCKTDSTATRSSANREGWPADESSARSGSPGSGPEARARDTTPASTRGPGGGTHARPAGQHQKVPG